MKPLITNQRVFKWLCICPSEKNDSKCQKSLYVMWSAFSVIWIIIGMIVSLSFFLKYVSTDLEASIYAIQQITGSSNFLYTFLNAFIFRHKILTIFTGLADIFEKCKYFNFKIDWFLQEHSGNIENEIEFLSFSDKNTDLYQFLINTNDTCERMWRFYFKYAVLGLGVVIPLLSSIFSVLISRLIYGDDFTEHLYHSYNML